MSKFASTLILVVAIISVQGGPVTYDEILAAARQQQFDKVQEFPQSETDSEDEMQLRSNFGKNTEVWKPSFNSVRDLKPADGAHVYGEAEYSFHSASNIDGKTSEEHAGHKIINDDGKIEEFDFTPSSTQFPLLSPIITSLGGHSPISNDYGADYSFHHVPVGVGEMSEYISGKKVDSKNKNTALSALKLPITPISFTGVRDLKPEKGGQVYGEAQYAYRSATSVNGKTTEDKGGHKIINNNGKVKEFDFTPSADQTNVSFF
ncbi:uncharacterized protein LOC110383862 isoform X1 [Helicoverpa armigera]|uniref:uncharacterized protein LOC110383862 isoform X1 n=1 Tax=Helicoverpa armigera TaxID=29058 RepID=UPI00308330D5